MHYLWMVLNELFLRIINAVLSDSHSMAPELKPSCKCVMAHIVSHFVLSDMLLRQCDQSGGWRSDKDLVLIKDWMTSSG